MLRYHVINLRSRVDRLIRIQERLTHPFTVHPAVTRKEAAHARVSRALRPHPWTDPLLHRPINDAEIACFLSHFALWARCAQESDPFVILEDDVEPTPEWSLEAIDRFLGDPSAGANRFDLLYLHYREMREARPATPELLYPTYPYWACAYAITPQGAQKLLRASPLTNGLIPVDEFLATMIGYRHTPPNEGVNRTYGEAPVLRAAALRQPLYRVESRKFLVRSAIAARRTGGLENS